MRKVTRKTTQGKVSYPLITAIAALVIVAAGAGWYWKSTYTGTATPPVPVIQQPTPNTPESNKAPEETIKKSELPTPEITNPKSGEALVSPAKIEGRAGGALFFEGTFPIALEDDKGNVLATGIATGTGDWMTSDLVGFRATVSFTQPSVTIKGFIVLKNDNPSGLRENEQEQRIPVTIAGKGQAKTPSNLPECKVGGCSGQVCSDKNVISTCEYTPAYACYKTATCARQSDGQCGWTPSKELSACLEKNKAAPVAY